MKKFTIFSILFFFTLNIYATKCTHIDDNEIRYVNNQLPLNSILQHKLRNQPLWQRFIQNNPNWFVLFNEYNLLPHRAFGEPVILDNGSTNSDKVLNFLDINNFTLPVDLRANPETKNDKYVHVNFTQYYNSLEVIDSRLYAKLTLNHELVVFGLDVFNDIDISVLPTLTTQDAILAASEDINSLITNSSVDHDLRILPVPNNKKYEYHLVYVVHIETRIEEGPADYICYVDAKNGELLMRKNQVMNQSPPITTNIHVDGEVYTTNPYNPSSVENFAYLKVTHNNTNYFTDSLGEVVLPSNTGNATYYLEGLYAEVQTNSVVPSFTSSLSNNNVVFDNTNSTISERTAFYAVNNIHTHFKKYFPLFGGLDFSMETNVDLATNTCNAYYTGGTLNFYHEGGGCNASAKIPDIAYHEYGHAINDYRYNSGAGMWNSGLNEGTADIWALSLTGYPVLGEGWYLNDSSSYIRRYDQDRKVYPEDLIGEVHADGEIICGAFWDTYLNLGDMQQALDLFTNLYDGGPDGPDGTEGVIYTDILLEFLYSDDDDGNIFNGTPNDNAIVDAFALHGITLLSNAVLTHTEINESLAGVQIDLDANIFMTYPWALNNAFCHYKLNNSTIWDSIPLTIVSSNNYSAQIPSQSEGNVVAYYLSLVDNYGKKAAITPFSAHLDNHPNLPYFILVGYGLIEVQDFDFNIGFWSTSHPSDNATTGLWEIGIPEGTYYNGTIPVQTSTQHSPGGSLCAFTGNDFTGGSIGSNDVDGGHTTLTSPTYDLTTYNNPTFSYYRWYTNSPPTGANPGADWWQVQVTDDGINWVYVENNMTSDNRWRKVSFRVSDYVTITPNFSIRFIASDSIRLGQYLDGGSIVEAAIDDLMLYEVILYIGCTDSTAINYDSTVIIINNSNCIYCNISNTFMSNSPTTISSCDGFAIANVTSNYPITSYSWVNTSGTIVSTSNIAFGLCNDAYIVTITDSAGCTFVDTLILGTIYACTDPLATNYNPFASIDDGSCVYPNIYGCTDSLAYNYNPIANTDDGSCLYCNLTFSLFISQNSSPSACDGWTFANANSSNPPISYSWSNGSTQNNATALCSGTYTLTITDAAGCTADTTFTIGSVPIYGCTDPTANNYDPTATIDDGSCTYVNCGSITGVNLTDVIHDRATFNWDNMNSSTCDVDQIRFRYREVGTSSYSTKTMGVPTGSGCNTSNTSKLVLGLNPSTTYEYDFKIWYCNASTVNWHSGGNFTTAPDCDNVINVVPTPITTTKTQFCWDSVSTYAFVRLQYRENVPGSSFSNIGGMGVFSPTLCKDKNGLTPGTDYRVMWRTWCSPNGGPYRSPQWDGPVTWTQPNSIRVEGEIAINNLEVYPNPSRDVFNIEFTSETKQKIEVRVVNLIGEIIFSENLENFEGEYIHSFNLSEYSKGVYLLELDTDNGIVNKKLILQ